MEAKVDLFGVEELNGFFETMERKDQRKVILDSYRIGTKPLIKTARQNIKTRVKTKTDRTLYKSLGFVALRARRSSVFASAKVGARRFKRYKGFHGHLMDAGTTTRRTSKGHDRGKMSGTNFFSDAVDSTEKQIMEQSSAAVITAMNKLIEKNLKKIQQK